jgi:hypothetical protein
MKVSLANLRLVLREQKRSAWNTWVIADTRGGLVSHWNGQRYPRLTK